MTTALEIAAGVWLAGTILVTCFAFFERFTPEAKRDARLHLIAAGASLLTGVFWPIVLTVYALDAWFWRRADAKRDAAVEEVFMGGGGMLELTSTSPTPPSVPMGYTLWGTEEGGSQRPIAQFEDDGDARRYMRELKDTLGTPGYWLECADGHMLRGDRLIGLEVTVSNWQHWSVR